ncbi:hypothetical protein, partial [Sandarakinorhabdus rubra]|uniref:hypothetical protein n=1 Tax=Sandarakinorhabdus rubra TaxID=2672568 RepID=UPI001969D31A
MHPPLPFDPALRRRRHAEAQVGLAAAGFLHARMAQDLRDRAALVDRRFEAVLDLGGPAPVWPGAVRAVVAAGDADGAGEQKGLA